MRIIVRSDDTNINLPLPTGLVLNRLTASVAAKAAGENGVQITGQQLYALIAAVKQYKKAHPDWCLVEVESANGEYVMIRL